VPVRTGFIKHNWRVTVSISRRG